MTFIVYLIYLAVMSFWVSGKSLSDQVHQTPTHLLTKAESTVQIYCSHTIQDYYTILWYEQLKGDTALRLIGYVYYKNPSIENDFTNQFNIEGDGANASTLHLKLEKKPVGSTAMYYCAASKQNNANPAYFGNGTKLTVLDKDVTVTEPKVTILKPSEKELCKKEKTVTLVCVATNFYPDHVTIKWKIGENKVTKGVATDQYATKNETDKKFKMSSRLQVSKKVWTKSKSKFTCIVTFFNGNKTYDISTKATATGIAGGFDQEDHITRTQTVKLAYGVFIAKSGLYGIFIMLFILRQGSAGKK